jgi:hypothetical protein
MIDTPLLEDALIDAVRRLKGKCWRRVVRDLRGQFEAGERFYFGALAKALDIELERLLAEFCAQVFSKTGELLIPTARLH